MKYWIKKVYRYLFPERDAIYFSELEKQLNGVKSVLDLGCGSTSPIKNIKKNFVAVGIDCWEKEIEDSKKLKIHDEYYLLDVLNIDKVFAEKSFDAVLALDLIEHLTKEQGKLLIDKMEKIAKKKVIIFTPNGFVKQEPTKDNPFREHKSGWNYYETKKLGYKCFGMNGIKFIKREGANIIQKPERFWNIIADISQKFVYHFPSLAFQLFCVKKL